MIPGGKAVKVAKNVVNAVEDIKAATKAVKTVEKVVTAGEKIVTSGEKVVTTGEKVVTSTEKVVASTEKVVTSGEKFVASGEKAVASGEKAAKNAPVIKTESPGSNVKTQTNANKTPSQGLGNGMIPNKSLPELQISASKYPELAENIANAQKAGHPDILTHGGNSAANRAASLESVPNIKKGVLSRDEYPFASSIEGGKGSWVGHVPVSQQNAQGALIKNFLKKNNIKHGDRYRIVIVP